LGVPAVAPNTMAMRELFPESSHHLLFNPRSSNDLRRAVLALVDMSAETRKFIARDYIDQARLCKPQIVSKALGEIYDDLLGVSDDIDLSEATSALSRGRSGLISDVLVQSRVPFLLQLISENTTMATRMSKAASNTLSNQQLALEIVKATLVGSVRAGISDDLILNNVSHANKLAAERARLDGAYAVRLYRNILSRLEQPPVEKQAPDSSEQ